MSLRDLASKGLEGFDAKNDAISSRQGLPAGDYNTIVDKIGHRVFDSGWDAFGVTFEVMEGEHTGQKENVNISLAETSKNGKPILDFILDQNIKFIAKLGALLGVNIGEQDFDFDNETDAHEHLANKLHGQVGKAVILKVIEKPNKKDPSHPHRSYDLEEAEQPEIIEVTDDDMPWSEAPTPSDNEAPQGQPELPFD